MKGEAVGAATTLPRAPAVRAMALAVSLLAAGLVPVHAGEPFGERDRASTEAVQGLNAYAAYKMGDYETARAGWEELAQTGNTSAMLNLANLYGQGQGVPRDPARAAAWIRRAATLGDPRAQVELGLAFENGQGVPRDPQIAADWFRRAADQGDATAQFNLGVMLATAYGEGLEHSTATARQEAADWLRKAAAQGHPDARAFLTLLEAHP